MEKKSEIMIDHGALSKTESLFWDLLDEQNEQPHRPIGTYVWVDNLRTEITNPYLNTVSAEGIYEELW